MAAYPVHKLNLTEEEENKGYSLPTIKNEMFI
jgi:hypothetical protein